LARGGVAVAKTLTLSPSPQQDITWADAARRCKKSVPAYVAFAASWTARYFRELDRKKPDWVTFRMNEKVLLGKLLEAAKQSIPYLPRYVDQDLKGRVHLQDVLRRAIDEVEEHLREHSEEWE
jgi:hypothetical protein